MTPFRLRRLAGVTLRTPPGLWLARRTQIPRIARSLLRTLRSHSDFAGALIPTGQRTAEVTALNRDAARVWTAFARPASPASRFPSADARLDPPIAGLVLDGLLELDAGEEFISGIAAFPYLFENTPRAVVPLRLGRLAVRALRHAAHLSNSHAPVIAGHLYRFHALPLDPSSRHSFRSLDLSGIAAPSGWKAYPARASDAWTYWTREGAREKEDTTRATYKLYVSPAPSHVQETLRITLRAATLGTATVLKTGRGPAGALRPDKMVVYFERHEHMKEAARELTGLLAGTPTHGVPFSATITDDGLLSWGVDPPARGEWLADRESWRQSVTRTLARSLAIAGRCTAQPIEPWQFAVARLSVDGTPLEALSLEDPLRARGAGT
jgi:hypothetical protein